MKFKIDKVTISFNTMIVRGIELECEGKGIKEDPIIIDSTHTLPDLFRIQYSYLYINMIDCKA